MRIYKVANMDNIEVKTIVDQATKPFDKLLQEALNDGWEILRCGVSASEPRDTYWAILKRHYEEKEGE